MNSQQVQPYSQSMGELIDAEKAANPETPKPRPNKSTVRHSPIPACGHAFVFGCEPRHRNCGMCWFAFFQVHGQVTRTAEEVFDTYGEQALVSLRGRKFTTQFLKFLSTVSEFEKAVEAAKQ